MQSMVLNEYGKDAQFLKTERENPTVRSGEVLVRVAATNVNTVDTMIRSMGPDLTPISPDLPALLGRMYAGTGLQPVLGKKSSRLRHK